MKRIVLGVFAHVDAGKTTLSEALLYQSGAIRSLGRVDHKDAFLDTDQMERDRGITIYSKEALFNYGDLEAILLDTPGHVDFSAEAERTINVLDYAILVINGREGIQSHTETLAKILRARGVPAFIFVNKMDMEGADKANLLDDFHRLWGSKVVDFSAPESRDAFLENVSLTQEELLEELLETGDLRDSSIAAGIQQGNIWPCYFGSALKLQGVDELLDGMERFTLAPEYPGELGARVFKITRDSQGKRLTHLKITGGELSVRDVITSNEDKSQEEKVSQIRIYSGEKYKTVERAEAGQICVCPGLENTYAGQALGIEALKGDAATSLEPVLSYRMILPEDQDPFQFYGKVRELGEEDPKLALRWDQHTKEIILELMGPIQSSVLQSTIESRFGVKVEFGPGTIKYKETLAEPTYGIGHYEPLRHFAEVHLFLEPGPRGSGLTFKSICSEDRLDKNWQRLIRTHLAEKEHLGPLTASPITDIKISIVTGKAHLKHTEGGDFRQATYRAIHNALLKGRHKGQVILLEPYYDFRLTVPRELVGRALTDINRMGGEAQEELHQGDLVSGNSTNVDCENATIKGCCPVSTMSGYSEEIITYTKGRGRLICKAGEYRPCHDQTEVLESINYDAENDVENSGDSVFCQQGAGRLIKWSQVADLASVPSQEAKLLGAEDQGTEGSAAGNGRGAHHNFDAASGSAAEKELDRIFEKTYGPAKDRRIIEKKEITKPKESFAHQEILPEVLLVDGYNIIFAWGELKELAKVSFDGAREALIEILANYKGFKNCYLIVVFDAYKVSGNVGAVTQQSGITVVYTKEAETADMYIEKTTFNLDKKYYVRVATSDSLEQRIILGHGCHKVSAKEFKEEVQEANREIGRIIEEYKRGQGRNRISPEQLEPVDN